MGRKWRQNHLFSANNGDGGYRKRSRLTFMVGGIHWVSGRIWRLFFYVLFFFILEWYWEGILSSKGHGQRARMDYLEVIVSEGGWAFSVVLSFLASFESLHGIKGPPSPVTSLCLHPTHSEPLVATTGRLFPLIQPRPPYFLVDNTL